MESDHSEKLIKSNEDLFNVVSEHVARREISSGYIISNYHSFFFKDDQYFYSNSYNVEFERIPLKALLMFENEFELDCRRKLKKKCNMITCQKFDLSNSQDFLFSIFNVGGKNIKTDSNISKNMPLFSRRICCHIFVDSASIFEKTVELQLYLLSQRKINSHILQNEFVVYLYVEKKSEEIKSTFEETLDMSLIKIVKLKEYEKNADTIQLGRVFNMKKKSKLIITDKIGRVFYTGNYEINIISKLLCITDWQVTDFKLDEEKLPKNESQISKEEFLNFYNEMDLLFRQLKTKPSFEKMNVKVQIKLKEVIKVNSSRVEKEYYIDKIVDKSVLFYNSYFHKIFYKTLSSKINSNVINPHIYRRFKLKDRKKIEKAKVIYRGLLDANGIEDKGLVVKKRWFYEIGRVENSYKIYNKEGMIFHEEELEKLEDFSKMRNKIKKRIKKMPCNIESNYKIYKKKHKKNLLQEVTTVDGSEFWENEIGKKYLIYINFQDIDSETISVLGHLTQLRSLCGLSAFPNLDIISFLYVTDETEYNEDCKIFKNKLTIYIINEYQVINLYHCVNPFDNEISHVFLYIDEEGYLNPFTLTDINLLEDKLESFLFPKIEITKDQYSLTKKECNKFYIEDYLSFSKYEYRFTFGINLEKKKIYDQENRLVEEKYYSKGRLRIRSNDLEKEINSEDVSVFKFGSKLKDEVIKTDALFNTIVHKTIDLTVEKKNCDNCQELFVDYFDIYCCHFDSLIYCSKCVHADDYREHVNNSEGLENSENVEHKLKCENEHNLISIVNYEKAKQCGFLNNLEKYKLGCNAINFFKQIPKYDQGFCCSYCDKTKNDSIRYICLNCRGCNLILHCEGDSNANGFVEICQECFSLLIEHTKGTLDESLKQKVEYWIEIVEDRDKHIFDSHIYVKLNHPSGSYYLY